MSTVNMRIAHARAVVNKPKFRNGQVVFVDDESTYAEIISVESNDAGSYSYLLKMYHEEAYRIESDLRPLTRRERGEPPLQGKKD